VDYKHYMERHSWSETDRRKKHKDIS